VSEKIKTGATVYNRAGEKARYEGILNGIHYVTPEVITYGWEGEEDRDWGATTTWPEVFPKPPVGVLEEKVVELTARVEKRRAELDQIGAERSALEKRLSDASKHSPTFERLLTFIEGRITHVLHEKNGDYQITAIADLHTIEGDGGRDNWEKKLPLVSLFGDTKGNLNWNINKWRDGSGEWRWAMLCSGVEDAEAQRLAIISAELAELDKTLTPDGRLYAAEISVRRADRWGIEVPAKVRSLVDAYRVKADAAELQRLQGYADSAQAALVAHKKKMVPA